MPRAALVTGGSRGLGLALAGVLVSEGYSLTVAARDSDGLADAVRSLREQGGEAEAIAGDLSDEAFVCSLLVAHRQRYGRLDVLVNNVGTGFGQPVAEISTRRLDLQIGLNLRTAVLCYREAVPLLLDAGAEHGGAWVVNVCSRAAVEPQPWLSVYSATKAGLLSFSSAMNAELGARGVRSCALCPGTVATSLTDGGQLDGEQLITTGDVAEVLRLLLCLSPACQLPTVVLESRYDQAWRPPERSSDVAGVHARGD
jgi:NAD(P)-dependent dehydrogenase (short-subunit alcohol dehydrogenase family)